MKKHITVAAAEALATLGWEVVDVEKIGTSVSVAYHHPEKEGRITIWSDSFTTGIITYINVDGIPEGYYDLAECKFVEC